MASGNSSSCAISTHSSASATPSTPSYAPAFGNSVDVRAHHQPLLAVRPRLPQPAQIARRIHAHRHAQRLHACAQMRMNFVHRRRQKTARDASRLFAHGGDVFAFFNVRASARSLIERTNSLSARLAERIHPR